MPSRSFLGRLDEIWKEIKENDFLLIRGKMPISSGNQSLWQKGHWWVNIAYENTESLKES